MSQQLQKVLHMIFASSQPMIFYCDSSAHDLCDNNSCHKRKVYVNDNTAKTDSDTSYVYECKLNRLNSTSWAQKSQWGHLVLCVPSENLKSEDIKVKKKKKQHKATQLHLCN